MIDGKLAEGDLFDERFNPEYARPICDENGKTIPSHLEELTQARRAREVQALHAAMTGEGEDRPGLRSRTTP
jgi:hypothetical protein